MLHTGGSEAVSHYLTLLPPPPITAPTITPSQTLHHHHSTLRHGSSSVCHIILYDSSHTLFHQLMSEECISCTSPPHPPPPLRGRRQVAYPPQEVLGVNQPLLPQVLAKREEPFTLYHMNRKLTLEPKVSCMSLALQ